MPGVETSDHEAVKKEITGVTSGSGTVFPDSSIFDPGVVLAVWTIQRNLSADPSCRNPGGRAVYFSAERPKSEGCGIHNRNYLRELRCGTAVVQLETGRAEYLPDPRCGSGTFMHWYILGENRRKRWSGIPDPVPVSGIGKCIQLLLFDDRCVGLTMSLFLPMSAALTERVCVPES